MNHAAEERVINDETAVQVSEQTDTDVLVDEVSARTEAFAEDEFEE